MPARRLPALSFWLLSPLAPLFWGSPAAAEFVLSDPTSPVYYRQGIAAGEDLRVDKSTLIAGAVYAGGDIELKKDSRIEGEAVAGGEIEAPDGAISGEVLSGAPPLELPELLDRAAMRALADRVFDGDQRFQDATFDDVVFIDGRVELRGNLGGSGTILAAGEIRIDKGAGAPDGAPAGCLSLVADGDIRIAKERALCAALRSGGDVELDKGTVFEGVIVADGEVRIKKDARLSFVDFDQEAPQITFLSPAAEVFQADSTPLIEARLNDERSGVALDSLRLRLDGEERQAEAEVTAGGLKLTPDEPLSDGRHEIEIELEDGSANRALAGLVFGVDTVAPSLALALPPAPLLPNEAALFALSYRDATAGLDLATLSVSVDGDERTASCEAGPDGASCDFGVLPPGDHRVVAAIRDRAGHPAQAAGTVTVTADQEPPVLALLDLTDEIFNQPAPRFRCEYGDELSGVDPATFRLFLDGVDQTASCAVGPALARCQAPALAVGVHQIRIEIRDRAGLKAAVEGVFRMLLDEEPPELAITAPQSAQLINEPRPLVELAFADPGSGLAPDSLRLSVDGVDETGSCTPEDAGARCAISKLAAGAHQIEVEIDDRAGNRATASAAFELIIDETPPVLILSSPADGALLSQATVVISGTARDDETGLVSLSLDGASVSPAADGSFAAEAALAEGANAVEALATDRAGNVSRASLELIRDATAPALTVLAPTALARTHAATVAVEGTASDAGGLAAVTVNGLPAALDGGRFTAEVALFEGRQTIVARAVDRAGNRAEQTVEVERLVLPAITISEPRDGALVTGAALRVAGTVDRPVARVAVNGVPAELAGNAWSADVELAEGRNLLTITAETAASAGLVSSASLSAVRDTTAPRLTIETPLPGAVVERPAISVGGALHDLSPAGLEVTVAGIEATVELGRFAAVDVPLEIGMNDLLVEARDEAGNVARHTVEVERRAARSGRRLEIVSGNAQSGARGAALLEPLVVDLHDADGQPLSGETVILTIERGSGRLAAAGESRRALALSTDESGRITARWTLGDRAGAGSDRVLVEALGAPPVVLTAHAEATAPAQLVVDAGTPQTGLAGQPLALPLTVVVTDAGHNRLAGVPVTFAVREGGGRLSVGPSAAGGSSELVVSSDESGHAQARFVLGPEAGFDNNVVEVSVAGLEAPPAVFVASGRVAGDPAATRISGVVLDHTDRPLAGVSVEVAGHDLSTTTDAEGRFVLAPAPVGRVLLEVDGSTVARPGPWPHLEYELVTLPGQDNTVGLPIYLLPLDLEHAVAVDETTGGVLTLPELPGLELAIEPGSATFPDGSRSGLVSVTPVHADKVPMTPNFGQQPRLVLTIQPAGVHFDPPARLTLPNVDGLAPGAVTEVFSFDHDLGRFVTVASAAVSADGQRLVTEPGSGIVKGGWHCGGNPQTTGGAESATVAIESACASAGGNARLAKQGSCVNILALEALSLPAGETLELTAGGSPAPGEFRWEVIAAGPGQDASIAALSGAPRQTQRGSKVESRATFRGLKPGRARIRVTFTCRSGAETQDEIELIVYRVALEIESQQQITTADGQEAALIMLNCDRDEKNVRVRVEIEDDGETFENIFPLLDREVDGRTGRQRMVAEDDEILRAKLKIEPAGLRGTWMVSYLESFLQLYEATGDATEPFRPVKSLTVSPEVTVPANGIVADLRIESIKRTTTPDEISATFFPAVGNSNAGAKARVQSVVGDLKIREIRPVQIIENVDLIQDRATLARIFIDWSSPISELTNSASLGDVTVELEDFPLSESGRLLLFEKETFFSLEEKVVELTVDLAELLRSVGDDSVNLRSFHPTETGSLALSATVDPNDLLPETDESNNRLTSPEFQVRAAKFSSESPYKILFQPVTRTDAPVFDTTDFTSFAEKQLGYFVALTPLPEDAVDGDLVNALEEKFIFGEGLTYAFAIQPALHVETALRGYHKGVFILPQGALGSNLEGISTSLQNAVLIEEDAPAFAATHEIGHTFGFCDQYEYGGLLGSIPYLTGECGADWDEQAFPHGFVAASGWDVMKLALDGGPGNGSKLSVRPDRPTSVTRNFFSYMSNTQKNWVTQEHYQFLEKLFLFTEDESRFEKHAKAPEKRLLISGQILNGDRVELFPAYVIRGFETPVPPGGYALLVLDAYGGELGRGSFGGPSVELGEGQQSVPFSLTVPWPDAAAAIEIRHGERLLRRLERSVHAPQVEISRVQSLAFGQTAIEVRIDDPDDDQTYLYLAYSIDGGQTWSTLAREDLSGARRFVTDQLAKKKEVLLRALACDGLNCTEIRQPYSSGEVR